MACSALGGSWKRSSMSGRALTARGPPGTFSAAMGEHPDRRDDGGQSGSRLEGGAGIRPWGCMMSKRDDDVADWPGGQAELLRLSNRPSLGCPNHNRSARFGKITVVGFSYLSSPNSSGSLMPLVQAQMSG
jgi:hypothetical protein